MAQLDNRAKLRWEFFQLVGTTSVDGALTDNGESVDEIANRCVQYGIWNAQQFMIGVGGGERWRTTSATLSFSGSDATGGKFATLPADCMRIAGDDYTSAIRTPDGSLWGQLVSERDRFHVMGDYYYLLDDAGVEKLWLGRNASPPASAVLDYYYRHPTLTDDTGLATAGLIDFPEMARPLIPIEAADYAKDQAWFPGSDDQKAAIATARTTWRTKIEDGQARRTRQVKRMRSVRVNGSHYFA